MAMLRLSELADVTDGSLVGEDVEFDGVATDTRRAMAGALFIALQGPRFDGHDYLEQARNAGAVAALVSEPRPNVLPQVVVRSTRDALGRFAAHWRAQFDIPVLGITGSNGKTTVKEMVAAILESIGPVAVTAGNMNNEIGVPLTLLTIRDIHRYAVVEMGANHLGEIGYLSGLVSPGIAAITNAAPAHLKGFGSLEGVVAGKGEIFRGLRAGGVAVLNADDPHCADWRELWREGRIVTFAIDGEADVRGAEIEERGLEGSRFTLLMPEGPVKVSVAAPGRHNVRNAVAAAALAYCAGATPAQIQRGLSAFRPVGGRLQRHTHGAVEVIDDTYNANPASFEAALAVLTATPGYKVLVLGDMGELGEKGRAYHRAVGLQARAAGVEAMYAMGDLAAESVASFGETALHFDAPEPLVRSLRARLKDRQPAVVLVKGSRSMRMERIVEALLGGNSSRASGPGDPSVRTPMGLNRVIHE